ncbi:hypothetical protein PT273_08115 [Orbaceae bacterium ESL0727]|nr:hypothetical protein [Orbaceae bacterium ESL0727]
MKQIKIILILSVITFCAQANDDVPLLTDSELTQNLPARSLGSLSLDLKNQSIWQQNDNVTTSDRISARLYGNSHINQYIGLDLNARLRSQVNSRGHYQVEKNSRLDLQSFALNYTPNSDWRFIAGRTNIRNGVASGFNPTDWFKENSQVIFDTLDTADRREDRLGVVTLMGVWLNRDSIVNFGYRPNLHARPNTVASNRDVIGLGVDRTNPQDSIFIKYSQSSWDNLSLTLSSLYQRDQPSLGTELSFAVQDNLVLYSEWFGQRRQSLTDSAQKMHGQQQFYHQFANGLTWSLQESWVGNEDISLSFEHHFNETGLTQHQLRGWRRAIAQNNRPAYRIASLANVKQEPLAKQQLFSRFVWNNFWGDNDLTAITTITPMDGSGFNQVTLSAPIIPALRIDLQGYHYFGKANTIYGSSGRKNGLILSFIYTI